MLPTPIRARIVSQGILVLVGSILAACVGTWSLYKASPGAAGDGREFVLLPAALIPLTSGIAAAFWTRRARVSADENLASLAIVEGVALVIFALVGGFHAIVSMVWIGATLLVAPWWMLGSWLVRDEHRWPPRISHRQ